ncbi:hypothetical protein QR680_012356 [Steinernema hermaphroditum]|uniref:Uncharacterized protein n=1 Tax=Steinernema hermaphroditum TaxID=289476 RepID=A0AA39M0D8_9BILA|nr:hypothetical protein QR680_012356 [Steinernema hermaphroditum]
MSGTLPPVDEADGSSSPNIGYWKQSLYLLQERAPKPIAVACEYLIANRPPQYGSEFHGLIDRVEADEMLLQGGEGAYLVRASKRSADAYTLCMLFDGQVRNYKLYYDGNHYVGEKRFETMELLVADGLISMYIDKHASDYIRRMADEAIYEHSPYMQYNRQQNDKSSTVARQPTARCHNFAPHTFKMPHYCDYCRNYMWGLVQQGVRCADCGFAAHKKCSEKAVADCRPEAKYVRRQFGVELWTLCMAHRVHIPPVLAACIREVELRGLNAEGIYRVSGSHEQMERLKRQFDANYQSVDLSIIDDIHTVAGLLKLYLRQLPQQLIPFSVYKSLLSAFNNARQNPHDRAKACRKALEELNECHSFTLAALLGHLRVVAEHSGENKMSAENLATIFSPTIFCSGLQPVLPQQQHVLLNFLIQNPRALPQAS